MAREKLGEILIKAGLLDDASLQRALNEQARWGGPVGRYLVEMGMITEETLVRALSTQFRVPAVALDPPRLSISVGRMIPQEICERNGFICFRADPQKHFLDVAMSDPSNVDGLEEVRVATRFNVRPHLAAPSVIDKAIRLVFYGDMGFGNDVDLSPDSPFRNDPQTSELIRGGPPPVPPQPRAAPPPAPPAPPARRSPRDLIPLELQISETPHPPPMPRAALRADDHSTHATLQSLRPVAADESFHITLDVPAVDKEAHKSQSNLEERVVFLEAVHARDAAVIEGLIEALVKRGLLTRDDVQRVLTHK